MLFCQKQAQNRLLILTHRLKGLSLKISENHKINVFGPTELKLWPFKDALFNTIIHVSL